MKEKNLPGLLQPAPLFLLALLLLTFLPFLGETLYNTKGEPREAVVAMSMLQSGDWILPVSNGGDIPYKPPMFAWIIAVFGWLNGGVVTEYLSRLPSALAVIIMIMAGFQTARKHISTRNAMIMALITATSFEVHRAGTNCRVDMLLTMFMVCGSYAIFNKFNRTGHLFSVPGILLLSGAVLTKGPVGVVLPMFILWVYALINREKFVRATLESMAMGILSLILPALWYVAAYSQGGDGFLDLVIEENFGRMTGTMSYESHENPWTYNVITVIAGMAPYTLLVLLAAVPLFIHRERNLPFRVRLQRIRDSRWELFMCLYAVIVFVFYCIPSSKRSVYLLPMYPMLAWFVVQVAGKAIASARFAIKGFGFVMGITGILVPVIFMIVRYSGFEISGSSRMFVEAIRNVPITLTASVCIALAIVLSFKTIISAAKNNTWQTLVVTVAAVMVIFWSYSAFYQPTLLNSKSEKPIAEALAAEGYGTEKPIGGWMADPLSRFYQIDFYLNDKVKHNPAPAAGDAPLLVLRGELDEFQQRFGLDYEIIREFPSPTGKERRDILLINPIKKQ